jgi:ABC-type antimicrobial peptide transport system permease subunit
MISNYISIAWRNIFKNKIFSLLNISGLAIGMTCTILILLWVYNERSWNHSQKNYKEIYHTYANRNFNGEISTGPDMMFPLPKTAKQLFPEIKKGAVVSFGETMLMTVGDKKINRQTITVSDDFFDMFNYDFIQGNIASTKNPNGIVLTESSAKALFNSTDIMGKSILLPQNKTVIVSAVVKDPAPASTIKFEGVLNFNLIPEEVKRNETEWVNCGNRVFFQIREGTDIHNMERRILNLIQQKSPNENPTTKGSIILHPMSKWRLYEEFRNGKNTGGRIQYVNLFTGIAIIILIIACINFMNLSTARSEKRAREVGIRKTLGANRKQLLNQFLTESVLLALISFLLSVGLVYLILPLFNRLLEQTIQIPLNQPELWITAGAIILITGFFAGSYPALYLSGLQPIKVLKGGFTPGKQALLPRKILVTAQFIVSIILISATMIIYQQLAYARSRELGYDVKNLIMVGSSANSNQNYTALKNDLLNTGMVESVNRTSAPISTIFGFTSGVSWTGAPKDPNLVIGFLFADEGFAQTMKAKMIAGRDFRMGDTNTVIFNKEAIRLMGIKHPIGTDVTWAGRTRRIVGIIDNMIMTSPFEPPTPLMISYEDKWSNSTNIRIKTGADIGKALTQIGQVFKQYSPDNPFEYRFADAEFNNKFNNEDLISSLSMIFAGLAIFICCLGLFGLVSFAIERRTKEIGIRKVLGASVQQLLLLMSKEFLVLVAIAFLIAIPVAWWIMHEWLNNFSYRISIGPDVFILVGLVTLMICIATVSLNALKTATANPVKSLRSE